MLSVITGPIIRTEAELYVQMAHKMFLKWRLFLLRNLLFLLLSHYNTVDRGSINLFLGFRRYFRCGARSFRA